MASFKRALGKGLREADLYYYLALAAIGGKQPRSLDLSRIKEIESLLQAAVLLDSGKPQSKVLWAIIKYDYYLANGFRVPSPSIEELLVGLDRTLDSAESREIARHVPFSETPLTRALLARV